MTKPQPAYESAYWIPVSDKYPAGNIFVVVRNGINNKEIAKLLITPSGGKCWYNLDGDEIGFEPKEWLRE